MICDRSQGDRRQLVEVDLFSGETMQTVADDTLSWRYLAAGDDGCLLIGTDHHGDIVQLRRSSTNGSWRMKPISDMPCGFANASPSISPGTEIFLSVDCNAGRIAFWDISRESFQFDVVSTPNTMRGAEFLDKDRFVTWDADGTIQLWDLHQRSVMRRVTLPRYRHPGS
jgi:WD40 repeat protein